MPESANEQQESHGFDDGRRRRLLEVFTGVPATDGNRVDVLHDGVEIFPAMLEAIAGARRTVDFMTFVYWKGEVAQRFADALAERARAGVRVRVLLDGFGAAPMAREHKQQLRDAGVMVQEFRPLVSAQWWQLNMRTHRRALVCDEVVAFTGGVGIAQEWMDGGDREGALAWRDTHFRVQGPAVAGIRTAFVADWIENDHSVIGPEDRFPRLDPVGDTAVQVVRAASQFGWNDMALAVKALLEVARDHVRITTAYFRPPAAFREALIATAERGVQIEVLVPGPHAQPAHYRLAGEYHYEELLAGGLSIWHYQPTMHHSKIMTVDGEVALVGTTNVDARSFALNEQIGLLLHDPEVAGVLDGHFEEDRLDSLRVSPTGWPNRRWSRRAKEYAAHALTYPIRGAGAVR